MWFERQYDSITNVFILVSFRSGSPLALSTLNRVCISSSSVAICNPHCRLSAKSDSVHLYTNMWPSDKLAWKINGCEYCWDTSLWSFDVVGFRYLLSKNAQCPQRQASTAGESLSLLLVFGCALLVLGSNQIHHLKDKRQLCFRSSWYECPWFFGMLILLSVISPVVWEIVDFSNLETLKPFLQKKIMEEWMLHIKIIVLPSSPPQKISSNWMIIFH